MHTWVDPHFGGKYSWTNRRDSLVTIENRLPLADGVLPLRLKIQRDFLQTLFKKDPLAENDLFDTAVKSVLGQARYDAKFLQKIGTARLTYFGLRVAHYLKNLSDQGPSRREKKISVPVFSSRNWARFVILRNSLSLLNQFFSNPPLEVGDDHYGHVIYLGGFLNIYFLPEMVIECILNSARGRTIEAQIFANMLPAAYLSCRQLVLNTTIKDPLNKGIDDVIRQLRESDSRARDLIARADRVRGSYRDEVTVICLVYWAFYGAWELHGLKGLREPKEAFDQYLYGERRARLTSRLSTTREYYPDIHKRVADFELWKELCLGARGAAAKFFGLL